VARPCWISTSFLAIGFYRYIASLQPVNRIIDMSLRLTLISHAATKATRAAIFPLDEPLEPESYAKAAAVAGGMGRVDGAWTSPALRAVQTAKALGLEAAIDPALRDIDLGQWAGKSLAELEAADPLGLARWMEDVSAAPHGGESVDRLLQRVSGWLDTVSRSTGRLVAVTHAAVIRAAAVIALDAHPQSFWRIDVEPLCFSRLQARGGRWTVSYLNASAVGCRRSGSVQS
jgi:broad specificity phosphatase PhoE